MRVVTVRRYPVKSLGGEALDRATLDERGLAGDRWWAVRDAEGRFASAKSTRRFVRRDAVLRYAARTTSGGAVEVEGPEGRWRVGDDELDRRLSLATGAAVQVAAEGAVPHQDAGAVSLVGTATLDWCAAQWGIDADPRRLRVNLVVATTEPFVEESWLARAVQVGTAVLGVVARAPRCRTVDLVQDGASPRGSWLRPLAAERDTCLAVYADVLSTGDVACGDPVVVLGPDGATGA